MIGLNILCVQLFVNLKPLSFTVLNALKFVKIKTLQYHGASIIKTSDNFKGPLNHAKF